MTTIDTQISAAENPNLANELAAKAMSDQEAAVNSVKAEIQLPPDTLVELPGGFLDPFEGIINTAEVRELNGADEEAVSKLNDSGRALLALLDRAVVKVGEQPAKKDILDALLAGDRETLLLAIRKVTFGTEVKLGPTCPECGEDQVFVVDLDKDVPMKKLNEEDRFFTVKCKVGTVKLTLPTGAAQRDLISATNKNVAELDSILLKHCIISINDSVTVSMQQIRELSLKDRRELLNAISERNPGPKLTEIKKTCSACGQEVPLPLSLAELFRE